MAPPYGALRGTRIVATLPPPEENSGVNDGMARSWIEAMRRHGAEIFLFDVGYVHRGDLSMLFHQLGPLAEFRPDMVISTPTAMHVLRCKTGNIVLGDGRYVPDNLFVTNLRLPTIFIWDTMAEMFATLGVPYLDPQRSRSHVLDDLRVQINDPLCYHCAFDQQHVDTMRSLGVLTTPKVRVKLATGQPHHVARGLEADEAGYDETVSFTGNLFSPRPPRGEGRTRGTLKRLLDHVLAAFDRDPGTSYWQAVEEGMAMLGADACREAKLIYDESFFWEYLCVDVMSSATTRNRLNMLTACKHPVSVYGLMFDPNSSHLLARHPHLTPKGAVDYTTGLPRLNRRSKVTLDAVTAHFPTSTTFKIASCFASRGLCLFNAKPAFHAAFGSPADLVMYRDADDMNAKLDYLLTHDRERADLIDYFAAKVHAEHTTIGLLAEMVAWVKETRP